jgi:DNA polymerase
MSLAGAGAALGLPADKAKDAAGKALIRFFCIPCKPTKANGHRHRNLPHHDRAKWAQFCAYCVQDVVAEVEIDARLARYTIPAWEHAMYALDQRINDRGVRVDTQLAEAALRIDAVARDRALRRIARITGLENPNSVAQLKRWLSFKSILIATNARPEYIWQ